MRNCKKAYKANIFIEQILINLSTNKSVLDIKEQFNELESMNALDIVPCMECGACLDFLFYMQTLDKVMKNELSNENLKHELQTWKKAQLTDQALIHMNYELKQEDFNKSPTNITGIKVYLDQNILSQYAKEPELKSRLNELKNNRELSFYYSPSHLEEIFKIPNEKSKLLVISSLRELTNNVIILPENDINAFFVEEPKFGLRRVAHYDGSTQVLEELMVVSSKDREMYLDKYDTKGHKDRIANDNDIFNSLSDEKFRELILLSNSQMFDKKSFKGIKNRVTLLHAIYTLSNSLTLIGYKLDKKEKTIKSARHDIEHLVYASEAELFVTNDRGLMSRANQIYKFMGIKTKAIALDELDNAV